MSLGPETTIVLEALRKASENDGEPGWRDVYLDNARSLVPVYMTANTFRSYLAKLSQHGLYRPLDGYAFGTVKMESPTENEAYLGITH